MTWLTRDDVEHLGRPARNRTHACVDEYNCGWGYWRFDPTCVETPFSDGHDYAGHPSIPYDGWELDEPLALSSEAAARLLSEVRGLRRDLHDIAEPARRADRRQAAQAACRRLDGLVDLLAPRKE